MPCSRLNLSLLALPLLATVHPAWAAEVETGAEAPAIIVTGKNLSYRSHDASSIKTGTPLIDTPQSITALARAQLDDQGLSQLNAALRYVPGVVLNLGEGHRDQIALRGQSTTADFFLDGLRDDAQYYRPLYNTERVEVLKGANALLFGRGGGGGVVNRVSKAPLFSASKGTVAASGNSFGAWSLGADANLPLHEGAAFRINTAYETFASHRDQYHGSFTGIAPTLALRLGDKTQLTAAYEFNRDRRLTDRGIPAQPGGTLAAPALPLMGLADTFFGDPVFNRSRVDAHIARLRLDHTFSDNLTLNISGQFAHYDKYYGNIVPGAVNAARTLVSLTGYRSSTTRDNWIGQANLVWKVQTGMLHHTLLAGVDAGQQNTLAARDDVRFNGAAAVNVPLLARIIVPPSSLVVLNKNQSKVTTLSAFVQDQIAFGNHLQLIVGARRDQFRIAATNVLNGAETARTDGTWSPRLGLVIKPKPHLSLYASYAKSFLPQAGDQFTTLAANLQTLAPEAFRNLEAGVKWDSPQGFSFTAAVYQIDRSNTRANDPITGNPVLTGSSRVRGFETALSGKITPAWQLNLGYSQQTGTIRSDTTAATAGRALPQLPRSQITLWSRYDLTKRLGLGLGLLHQSSQFATISNTVRLPGFTRLDAAAYFDVTARFALQINVENLTNTSYYPSAHTDNNIATGEPLNARITARVKF